jgi:hypothetical protein
MKTYPRPHSSAWFEHMLVLNTPLAIHAGHIIAAVANHIGKAGKDGAERCCGACGDMPDDLEIKDVIVTNQHLEQWPARLCVECIEIQKQQFDLVFRNPHPGEIEK